MMISKCVAVFLLVKYFKVRSQSKIRVIGTYCFGFVSGRTVANPRRRGSNDLLGTLTGLGRIFGAHRDSTAYGMFRVPTITGSALYNSGARVPPGGSGDSVHIREA